MINTEKLKKLKDLLDAGAITQEEFEQQKSMLFSESSPKSKISDKVKIALGIVAVVLICFAIIGAFVPSNETSHTVSTQEFPKNNIPKEFRDNGQLLNIFNINT